MRVPVSVTVASWEIDGVSYIATNKSLTDHGISFIAGQDCALHRVVTEMDIEAVCQQYEDPASKTIAIADASEIIEQQIAKNDAVNESFQGFDMRIPPELGRRPSLGMNKAPEKELSIEEIANFETASGGPDQSDFEKLADPENDRGFNIKGIWSFFKNLTG